MKLETILNSLQAAETLLKAPLQEAVSQALKDAYCATKAYLQKKLGNDYADLQPATSEADPELDRLSEELQSLIANARTPAAEVHVIGSHNHVQYAARDLVIKTERNVRRNVVIPDERHLSGPQLETVRNLIKEVAGRISGTDSEIKFAAVHRMLQRRFGIASYLLISRECGEEAIGYLKQQRTILSGKGKYQNDLFRSIFAGAREMGWDRFQVYLFAAETLHLKQPIQSLKQLNHPQLKELCQAVRCAVGKFRAKEYAQSCAS